MNNKLKYIFESGVQVKEFWIVQPWTKLLGINAKDVNNLQPDSKTWPLFHSASRYTSPSG